MAQQSDWQRFRAHGALRKQRNFSARAMNATPVAIEKNAEEKWQPVGESNPSFQVENLAS
jgi:hypothetical protein